jgi:hypothetical protein
MYFYPSFLFADLFRAFVFVCAEGARLNNGPKITTVSDKAQEASYAVAEIVGPNG